ncbi:hypothetical protein NKG05_26995 [Oerskovia sp. M15]
MEERPPAGLSSRDKILWAAATMLGGVRDDPERPGRRRTGRGEHGVRAASLSHPARADGRGARPGLRHRASR